MTHLSTFRSLEDNNGDINRINSQDEEDPGSRKPGHHEVIQEIEAELDILLNFIQDFSIEKSPRIQKRTSEESASLSRITTRTSGCDATSHLVTSINSEHPEEDPSNLRNSREVMSSNLRNRSSCLSKQSSLGSLVFGDSYQHHDHETSSSTCSPTQLDSLKSTKSSHSKAPGLSLVLSSPEFHHHETRVIKCFKKTPTTSTTPDEEICNNARILAAELKQQLSLCGNKVINSSNPSCLKQHKKSPLKSPSLSQNTTRGHHCLVVSYIELILTVIFNGSYYSGNISLSSYSKDDKEVAQSVERRAVDASTIKSVWDALTYREEDDDDSNQDSKRNSESGNKLPSNSFPNLVDSKHELPIFDSLPDRVKESLTEKGNRIRLDLERDHDYQVYDWKTNAKSLEDDEVTKEMKSEGKIVVYEKVVMFKKMMKAKDEKSQHDMKGILDTMIISE